MSVDDGVCGLSGVDEDGLLTDGAGGHDVVLGDVDSAVMVAGVAMGEAVDAMTVGAGEGKEVQLMTAGLIAMRTTSGYGAAHRDEMEGEGNRWEKEEEEERGWRRDRVVEAGVRSVEL